MTVCASVHVCTGHFVSELASTVCNGYTEFLVYDSRGRHHHMYNWSDASALCRLNNSTLPSAVLAPDSLKSTCLSKLVQHNEILRQQYFLYTWQKSCTSPAELCYYYFVEVKQQQLYSYRDHTPVNANSIYLPLCERGKGASRCNI